MGKDLHSIHWGGTNTVWYVISHFTTTVKTDMKWQQHLQQLQCKCGVSGSTHFSCAAQQALKQRQSKLLLSPWEHVHISQTYAYEGLFRHKTTHKSALVATGMPEVVSQLSAIVVLCYFWQVKLRMPLARHKTRRSAAQYRMQLEAPASAALCRHGCRMDGWVLTIIRSNNCFISSHNTWLTPFDGLRVSLTA